MSNEAIIFTDGACLGNPGPGGYAAVITIAGEEQIIIGRDRSTTNNKMEMTAAIKAAQLSQRVRTAVLVDSWYRKSHPTFADALAAVRQAICRETGLLTSRYQHKMPKPSQALRRCLIYALCRAA
jgi:hypothetical protein